MIMLLLFILLVSLLFYEEKKKREDDEVDENFEIVLEDMIDQLHSNQFEIIKNKSSSLVLLKMLNKLIKSLQTSYEEKLLRWENELNKLKILQNQNIEAQIKQCREDDIIPDYEGIYETVVKTEKQNFLVNSSPERNVSNKNEDNPNKINNISAKKPHKGFGKENFSIEQNIQGVQENFLFDLEKEIMNSPILRNIMDSVKFDEFMGCNEIPFQRMSSFSNASMFRIYEFSNLENDGTSEDECNNLLTSNKRMNSNLINIPEEPKGNEQFGGTGLFKYIKTSSPSIMSNTFSLSNSPGLSKGTRQCNEKLVNDSVNISKKRGKVQFQDANIQDKCPKIQEINYSSRNASVQNLSWYCGPNKHKTPEVDKLNTKLFEYKLRQPRIREPYCREGIGIQSFNNWQEISTCSRAKDMFNHRAGRAGAYCDFECLDFGSDNS